MKNSTRKSLAMKLTAMALAALMAVSMLTVTAFAEEEAAAVYKIGICNYVDDASLNQIVDNIQSRLEEIGEENGVT